MPAYNYIVFSCCIVYLNSPSPLHSPAWEVMAHPQDRSGFHLSVRMGRQQSTQRYRLREREREGGSTILFSTIHPVSLTPHPLCFLATSREDYHHSIRYSDPWCCITTVMCMWNIRLLLFAKHELMPAETVSPHFCMPVDFLKTEFIVGTKAWKNFLQDNKLGSVMYVHAKCI